MTKPLTLSEISRLAENGMSPEDFMNDERIQLFIDRVETAGKEILKKRGSGKYAKDAADFLFAGVLVEFIMDGDFDSLKLLMENSTVFRKTLGVMFIYCVGLGVVEELY